MFKKIFFLLFYLFVWTVFFQATRLFFVLSQWQDVNKTPAGLLLKSFWYGLKMDVSMAGYISLPVCLFVIIGLFISFFRRKTIYFIYTALVLLAQQLLILADAEAYKAWGTRIDFTPIKYLATPKEAYASVSHLPLFWILIGFIALFVLLFWIFRKSLSKSFVLLQNNEKWFLQMLLLLVFTGLLIIPIRGGVQLAPLNQSSVYFCNNRFANTAALNASWNFTYSVMHRDLLSGNPFVYMKDEEAAAIVKELYKSGSVTEQVIDTAQKPNIIFIVWESFTEKALHKNINGQPVIPFFPQLMKEGIYFSNCYASGNRTEKGISAVLAGYPALPQGSIVNYPEKTNRLTGLGNVFADKKYSTHFYYGGEAEFGNIKSFLSAQHFEQFVTKENFNSDEMNSKWGAHDGVVMERLVKDIPQMQQPFFCTWLTLSSHEPFETPVATVFNGKDDETKFLNSLHYADSCVYTFISELKKLPLWKNTIVIITADHGHRMPVTDKQADDFRIPVLWLGGALKKQNIVIDKTVSQVDMAGSLVQQFNPSPGNFPFSKNVFDSTTAHWAFFSYNEGFGVATDSSRLIFNATGKRVIFEDGKSNSGQLKISQALMQAIYDDFLKR